MPTTAIDDLSSVLGAVGDLVAGIRKDQWAAPTPCPEWDVYDLVNHVVMGNCLFAGILRDETALAPGALNPKAGDLLRDDPLLAYQQAAQDLHVAAMLPGTLERVVKVPVGVVPGIAAVHLRTVEGLVHGWDLAQATGQLLLVPDDVVERELEFAHGKLADVPPERSPFAPPQPVPDHASPLDRLVALLGRSASP